MFVDAAADRLAAAEHRYTSAIAVWETVAGLRKSHGFSISTARELVGEFVADHHFERIEIG